MYRSTESKTFYPTPPMALIGDEEQKVKKKEEQKERDRGRGQDKKELQHNRIVVVTPTAGG